MLPIICAVPLAGQLSVFELSNTVTFDGSIGGTEWNDATAASSIVLGNLGAVTGTGFSAPTDGADLSGTVRLKWDSSNLYALFQITDDIRGEDSADGNGIALDLNSFNDDSVELYFSDTYPDSGNLDGSNRYQYRFNPNSNALDQEIESTPIIGANEAGIVWGVQESGTNYVVEVAIPWSNLGLGSSPVIGNSFSFMAGVNDDDGVDTGGGSDTDRQHQLFWNSTFDSAYDDATQWSQITLAAAIPEPSTYAMIFGCVGLAAVIFVKRRRAAKAE